MNIVVWIVVLSSTLYPDIKPITNDELFFLSESECLETVKRVRKEENTDARFIKIECKPKVIKKYKQVNIEDFYTEKET